MIIDKDNPDKKWLLWEDNTLIWGDKDGFKWDEVFILLRKVKGIIEVGGIDKLSPLEDIGKKISEDEKEKLIKVVCEVNGMVYVSSKRKKLEKSITIDQINRTIEKVLNVKVDI